MVTIQLNGNLGRDIEMRDAGEHKVGAFSVATTRLVKGEKTTEWYNCQVWNPRGLADYLKKGQSVTIAGDLHQNEHEGKIYYTVNANHVELTGGKSQNDQSTQSAAVNDNDPLGINDLPV